MNAARRKQIADAECTECDWIGTAADVTGGECPQCHARDMEMEARYDDSRE